MVREPKIKAAAEESSDMTFWEKFRSLSEEAWNEVKSRPKYTFCFICLLVTRLVSVLFSVYMQLWVMSFVKSGVISSEEEGDRIYMTIVGFAMAATLVVAPAFGLLSDKADPRVIVPTSFFLRGMIAFSFRFIDDPTELHAYILSITMIVVSVIQFLCVEVLFMRNMKANIRGTLTGLAFFFGSVGTTTFALIGGILFDKVAPWAPFMVVGTADATVFLVCITFLAFGLIKRDD